MTETKENKNEIRVEYPNDDFPDTVVILPKHWLGEHCQKRDVALLVSKEYKSVELTNLCISLMIADGFENIPGVEGEDPAKWDLSRKSAISGETTGQSPVTRMTTSIPYLWQAPK